MFNDSKRIFAALILMCGILALFPAFAQGPFTMEHQALATALRGGGFVIVVRHGATFADQSDTDPFHLVKEGEASIFRPENGRYTLVDGVQMADWSRIAAAAK